MKPKYWTQACRELGKDDPILRKMIAKYPGEILISRGDAFETLLRSIVGQQISVKAAQSVWNKVLIEVVPMKPTTVIEKSVESLRACGLSGRKVEYAKDLAVKFHDGSLAVASWPELDDEIIIEHLITIRGIGRWTAEMFLMFHLLRPNIFPKDDLGLQKGIAVAYKKKYPMSDRQLEIFRKKYHPWGTVASWYLWRSLDPIPVQY
jgi:DNA-3-methyladenine glycosylase II